MKKWIRYSLIAAGASLVIGGGLLTTAYALGGRTGFCITPRGIFTVDDFKQDQAWLEATLQKTELEPIKKIEVDLDVGDVTVLASDHYGVEYRLPYWKTEPHYEMKDGVLTIKTAGEKRFDESLFLNNFWFFGPDQWDAGFYDGYVKIYLPQEAVLEEVTLVCGDGDLSCEQLSADQAVITDDYGKVKLIGGAVQDLTIKASDGEILYEDGTAGKAEIINGYGNTKLNRVKADTMEIKASDGKIELTQVDASGLYVKNSYGHVLGDGVQAEELSVTQSDGTIDLKTLTVTDGRFHNSYGRTLLELTGKREDYEYDLTTSYGHVELDGENYDSSYHSSSGTARKIKAEGSDGNIVIHMKE